MTRRLGRMALTLSLLTTALLGLSAAPAHAAPCSYPGGGAYGADLAGFLPAGGPAQAQYQEIIFNLVGYSDLPSGCVAGELDLVAYGVTGALGTCTLVLPKPVIDGAGCGSLLGNGGVGTAVGILGDSPSLLISVYAELTAIGTDGSRVVRVAGPCSGELDQYVHHGFRCSL